MSDAEKPTPSVREAIKDAERLFTCGSLAHGHVSTLSYLNPDMEPQKITSPATDLEAPRFPVSEKRAILMQKFGEDATYEQFVAFLGKQIAENWHPYGGNLKDQPDQTIMYLFKKFAA